MGTFITSLTPDPGLVGPTLAVKDLIDVAGVPTTYGSLAYVRSGQGEVPARIDARCLAGARRAGARLVGKTNLHELAFGGRGVNPWFGTPRNPLDPSRIPGGSSSGSAVAVATGVAEVAFGSDTGGSVRIPAACCGVVGLKTTMGRIPLEGCLPLAPSFDTIGPLAATVGGVVLGMTLLEPGFAVADAGALPPVIGRVVGDVPPADDSLWDAVTSALRMAEWPLAAVGLPGWQVVDRQAASASAAEAAAQWMWLCERFPEAVGADVAERLRHGAAVSREQVVEARLAMRVWRAQLEAVFAVTPLVVTPTLCIVPPRLDDELSPATLTAFTRVANAAGVPAVAVPIPLRGSHLQASLQLIAPWGREDLLLAAAARIEAATAR